MTIRLDIRKFLQENKEWFRNLQRTAEISVEGKIIKIQGVKGIQFESIIPAHIDIDKRSAHFLGLVFGDNCSTKQTSAQFGLSNTKLKLLKEAREQLEKTFLQPINKIRMRIKTSTTLSEEELSHMADIFTLPRKNVSQTFNSTCKQINIEVFINNRPLKRIVFEQLLPKLDSLLKRKMLLSFFAGVLDADGNLRKDFIAITLSSQKEIEIMTRVIKKLFQVNSHITPRKGKNASDIRIFGVNIVRQVLCDTAPFLCTTKGFDILA